MVSEVTSTIMMSVFEHFSKVWIELILAIIAAIIYFNLSAKQSASSKQAESNTPQYESTTKPSAQQNSEESEQELTASQLALRAMRQGRMADAIGLVHRSPDCLRRAPFDVACRFLTAVATTPKLLGMTAELRAFRGKISSQALEATIATMAKSQDAACCRQLHKLSGILSIPKTDQVFEALAKAYATDAIALQVLVEEAGSPLATSFAEAALTSCAQLKNTRLQHEIMEKASPADAEYLAAVSQKLTGVKDVAPILKPTHDSSEGTIGLDMLTETVKQQARDSANASKEIAMRANDIRSCGKNGDLKGAIKIYERLGSQAHSTLIINSLLDACVECKDMAKALEYFNQPELQAVTDVISYNTMMKGYLASGQEAAAKNLLTDLPKQGLTATRTSYHGLLNSRVNAGDLNGAWRLVTEMQASGISPNCVTCSILMKGKMNSASDASRVLALIDTMDQPMDEVLFPSVVDVCIRTGKLDLLSRQTEKFLKQGAAASLAAPTYGSMIKAYGHARDVRRVWHLWEQMLAHNVQPTSVTLGCMVEALVANGRASEAWQLVQDMWKGQQTRPLVNTVIYSSILKGFSRTKETEKVMALYEEMCANKIQANTITYNTILNAFAQGSAMHRVPALLEDMKAASPPVEPDIVTYSTIVKGFCNAGNLARALKVLDDMKSVGKHAPDEVMYNSLLAGCAKEHRADEALQLLNDMKTYNVAPSNYTLSMLVKLMGRCRRINQAFTMLEDISNEYGLKINIQVYTCLIQGCFNAGQAAKALTLLEKIIQEGLIPDAMTYTVMVRGCVQEGLLNKAVELAKAAYGRGPAQHKGASPGLNANCLEEVVSALGETSAEGKELMAELGNCKPASMQTSGGKGGKGNGKGYSRHPQSDAAPWRQQRA